MNKRVIELIVLGGILLIGLSFDASAQSESDETANVKKRAETLLQIIREKKWDEIGKLVVIVTEQIDEKTGDTMEKFHFADDKETKEKVISRFKQTYSVLRPGKIGGVSFDKKQKEIAHITYKHEDKDKFSMVLIDGEWYYKIKYLK